VTLSKGCVLAITVNFGRDLYDNATFGKIDPYCQVVLGGHHVKTSSKTNVGENPDWNETFSLPYGMETEILFRIFDKDALLKSDPIGEAEVSIAAIVNHGGQWTGNLPLRRKGGKDAGFLNVTVGVNEGGSQPGMQSTMGQQASNVTPIGQQQKKLDPSQPVMYPQQGA